MHFKGITPSPAFVTLSLALRALSATVYQDLHVVNANLAPDGFNRSTTVVNGQFPGPLISGNIGDNFKLNVFDDLTDPTMRRATSIHWHGLFQAHTPEMDGPSWVTQCPIVPDQSFLYDFSVPGQSGTYWYHSHLSTQYCDGLRGPLVLYDPNDPLKHMYDVDDETTIISLADWYHSVAPSVFPNEGNVDPVPNSTTVNGLGRFPGGPTSPLSITKVKQGKRYRLRFVSMSCDPAFQVSIDGHNMTIIEADGVETDPLTVDSFAIFPSQRYSVVLTADQPIDNYWIRVNPIDSGVPGINPFITGFDGGINSAILRYDGAAESDPTTTQNPNGVALNEADLSVLSSLGLTVPGEPFPGGVDFPLNLTIAINTTSGRHLVNNVTFIPPDVPVLLQILSGVTDANKLLPPGSVYGLPKNSSIEIVFSGQFPHPLHLHGHNFDVVRTAGSDTYNFVDPVRRDTVNIGINQSVTIRFTTDNPGPWFLHCHIDWHLEAGLAVVMAEDAPDVAVADPPNSAWDALCPNYAKFDPDTALEAKATQFIN